MKQKLIASITDRLENEVSPRNPVKFMQSMGPSDLVDAVTLILHTFTRGGGSFSRKSKSLPFMAEIISGIGHSIRSRAKLKKDSSLAAKSGAFLLWSFEKYGIVKTYLGKGNGKHATFLVETIDEEALDELFASVVINKIEKLPSLVPYEPWTTTKHSCGSVMVKTQNRGVLNELTIQTHPLVFECLNKAQRTGWNVNKDIYPIFTWALRNKAEAFADIWDMQNPEAKSSKLREARTVGSIAKRFLDETFYH